MNMVARLILYLFVFWLSGGNSHSPVLSHAVASCDSNRHLSQECCAFIDSENLLDQVEKAFPYILEEDSSQNNDDHNDDKKVLDRDSAPCCRAMTLARVCVQAVLIAPLLPYAGKANPLYLLHRIFRI